jgi:hypothetical protein
VFDPADVLSQASPDAQRASPQYGVEGVDGGGVEGVSVGVGPPGITGTGCVPDAPQESFPTSGIQFTVLDESKVLQKQFNLPLQPTNLPLSASPPLNCLNPEQLIPCVTVWFEVDAHASAVVHVPVNLPLLHN